MLPSIACLVLLAQAAPSAAAAPAAAPEILATVQMKLVPGLLTVDPNPQPLSRTLGAEAPATLDVSALPPGPKWFGTAPVTKTDSLAFAVAADRSAIWFDSDMNARLEAAERVAPDPAAGSPVAWFSVGGLVRQQEAAGEVHEAIIPMKVGVGPGSPPTGFTRLDCHREGEVTLGGRKVRLAVVDRTYRGWFSHPGRDALLVDVDGDGTWNVSEDSHERYRLGQPFPVGDLDVVMASAGPLGETLTLARSAKPARRLPSLEIGAAAPDFEAVALDGKAVKLSSLRGKWVLVDFWATWCMPCRGELPNMKALRKAQPDVVVLGISGDREKTALESMVAAGGLDWTHVFDEKGAIQVLYRVASLPRNYLIAPDGRIAAKDLRGPMLPDLIARERAKGK